MNVGGISEEYRRNYDEIDWSDRATKEELDAIYGGKKKCKVFLEDGSKVVKEHISNEVGAVITYRGTKPEWYAPQPVAADFYQQGYEAPPPAARCVLLSCLEAARRWLGRWLKPQGGAAHSGVAVHSGPARGLPQLADDTGKRAVAP